MTGIYLHHVENSYNKRRLPLYGKRFVKDKLIKFFFSEANGGPGHESSDEQQAAVQLNRLQRQHTNNDSSKNDEDEDEDDEREKVSWHLYLFLTSRFFG